MSSTVAGKPELGNADPTNQMLGVPASTGLSVAAAAVIAHEVGHALQDQQRDPWMTVRQAIVPAVQIGSSIGPWLIIGGLIFQRPGWPGSA